MLQTKSPDDSQTNLIIRAFSYAGIIKRSRFPFQVSKRTVECLPVTEDWN